MLDIQKCMAVQGYGAAGTLAVQALFDGHPDIIALPAAYGLDPYVFFGTDSVCPADDDTIDRFVAAVPHWFEPAETAAEMGLLQMGPNADEIIQIDSTLFREHLRAQWHGLTQVTRKQFLVSIYLAYNLCIGRDYSDRSGVLLFPIHKLPRYLADLLAEDFAEVRFLHMVREPVQNFGSFARHLYGAGVAKTASLLTLATSLIACDEITHRGGYPVHSLQPYLADRADGSIQSRAVRLEDIHKHPRQTLGALCGWLGIPWDDALNTTTFDGKIWNNFAGKIKVSGASEAVIKQNYDDMLYGFDSWRLALLLAPHRRAFGYSGAPGEKNKLIYRYLLPVLLLLPFKVELLPARILQMWKYKRTLQPLANAFTLALGFFADSARRYWTARKWLHKAWHTPFGQHEPFVALLPIAAETDLVRQPI